MKSRFFKIKGLLALCVVASSLSARAEINYVTNASYSSLLAATTAALQNGGDIVFAVGGSFVITNAINVSGNLVFDADGQDVTLSGNNATRVFYVGEQGSLVLKGIKVANGRSTSGGAILNDGGVEIYDCVFSGNSATNLNGATGSTNKYTGGNGGSGSMARGGAIHNRGSWSYLFVTNSVFSDNSATGGDGGTGGHGEANLILGGNGGNGGAGGNALGGAIYVEAGTTEIGATTFTNNICMAGNGGTGGAGGVGGANGDTGAGGQGGHGYGAGIYNAGTLSLNSCLFVDNGVFGGNSAGIDPYRDSHSRNAATGGGALGGAVLNIGQMTVENSTIYNNYCDGGAGGDTSGGKTAKAGNGGVAWGGGFASAGGTISMLNCTLATNWCFGGTNGVAGISGTNVISGLGGNNGRMGAALGGNVFQTNCTVIVSNSIFAQNKLYGGNCYGNLVDGGYNISSDSTCRFTAEGSLNNTNPELDSQLLETDYGRPAVLPVLGNSPAIEAIPSGFPEFDQIGTMRPQGDFGDIGAYEVPEADLVPTIVTQPQSARALLGSNVMFSVKAAGKNLSYQWSYRDVRTWLTTNVVSFRETNVVTYGFITTNTYSKLISTNDIVVTSGNILDPTSVNVTNVPITATFTSQVFTVTLTNVFFQAETNYQTTRQTNTIPVSFTFTNTGTFNNYFLNLSPILNTTNTMWVTNVAVISNYFKATNINYGTRWVVSTNSDFQAYDLTGETNSTLLLENLSLLDSGAYGVSVQNKFGRIVSTNAFLTVYEPLVIIQQPQNLTLIAGSEENGTGELSIETSGGTSVTYQWYFNGRALAGENYPNLVVTSPGTYRVVVKDWNTVFNSRTVTVTVVTPPSIVSEPADRKLVVGAATSFSVVAKGDALRYQWFKDSEPIKGATTAKYSIGKLKVSDAGQYYVRITNAVGELETTPAFLSVVPPAPTIIAPTAARTTNEYITLKGAASSIAGITDVFCRIGDCQAIRMNGTTTWSSDLLRLSPGTNRVAVYAVNASGESAETVKNYFLIRTTPLVVEVSAGGTVKPNYNGKSLEIGSAYSMTAYPSNGFILSSWTTNGEWASSTPKLSFLMSSGLVVRADFEKDPYAGLKGAYVGIYHDTNNANEVQLSNSGFINLALSPLGIFTAKIQQKNSTYILTGQFDSRGVPVTPSRYPVDINFDLAASSSNHVQGNVIGNGWTNRYQAHRLAPMQTNLQGRYTFEFRQDESLAGVVAVGLTSSNLVFLDGSLADGTRLKTLSGNVCVGGVWPFYYSLNGGSSAVIGNIWFTNAVSGNMTWIRNGATNLYSEDMSNVFGSRYTNSLPLLKLTNATVVIDDGVWSVTNSVTLPNAVFLAPSSTNRLILQVNRANGLVDGSFLHPQTKTVNKIQGVLLQNENMMEGVFAGASNRNGVVWVGVPLSRNTSTNIPPPELPGVTPNVAQ